MGDRRNVIVDSGSEAVVALYTHWTGSELPETVANALDRARDRWNDAPYLTRVIFAEMIKPDPTGTTGFGIEAVPRGSDNYTEADPGYDVYLDIREQQVCGFDGDGETWLSFEKFVADFKN